MSKKKEEQQQEQSAEMTRQPAFQRFARGTQEVDHHLFKLKVASMKRNLSWVYRSPNLVTVEHTHFFHSVNDTTLQPNRFSNPVGGHFHEILLEIDPETKEILSAKCGPAVAYQNKKVAGGRSIRRLERVRWERYNENPEPTIDPETGEMVDVSGPEASIVTEYDNHTHELEYLGYESLTAARKIERRKEETEKVKSLMSGQPVSKQPGALQKLENQPGSDAAKRVLREGSESAS